MVSVEVCVLILIASVVTAIPQFERSQLTNSSITTTSPSIRSGTFGFVHQESTATEFGADTTLIFTNDPFIKIESTATGFGLGPEPSDTAPLRDRPHQTQDVITTNTPTIIYIHTEVAVTGPNPYTSNEPRPQPTQGGPLLNEIISKIGGPRPGAQPSPQPASPTGDLIPNGVYQSAQGTENTEQPIPTATKLTDGPGAQSVIVTDELITLGPVTTLTLSNGLSTTVGTGSEVTFVALTTNTAGYTILVVSSSGTAVSATISNAPVTVTLPKTGFEASITAVARPGDLGNPSADAATATSSKGVATNRAVRDAWIGILMGLIGSGFIVS